ncbi:MAG: DUF2490 domain-containing protein [Chitinophagales bacterium]
MLRFLPALLLIFVFGQYSLAQSNILTQQQAWYSYFNQAEITDKWFLFSEVENRQFIKPSVENQLLMRLHLHYRLHKHWDVAMGFGYFLVNTQNPLKPSKLFIPEVRPFIEATNSNAWGKWNLTNRLRIDERFVHKTEAGELAPGYNISTRFRYRLGVDFTLLKSKKLHVLKLRFSNEVMVNIPMGVTKNIFDQNRAYLGLSYTPPGPITFEAGYMNLFQQRASLTDYFNRNIIRFSITHKVRFPERKKG